MEGQMGSHETAITRYESGEITQFRPPAQVLAEAKLAATALTEVIGLKKNKVTFNGEQYLEFEDWQTVGKFYGCTVKIVSTNYVEFGGVHGFEATAVVLDRNQSEISRAESMCLSDEENWGMVPKYEWQDELDGNGKKIWVDGKEGKKGFYKGKKVKVGESAKPLFQLRSMAQTRAGARALRQVFAWVVVLAGYKPTPAEEMTGNEEFYEEDRGTKKQVTQPQRASEKKQETTSQAEGQVQQQATDKKPEAVQQGATVNISGVIEDAKADPKGNLWMHVDKKLMVVNADRVDDDMAAGQVFTVRAIKKVSQKVGEFFEVMAVLENPQSETQEPAPTPEDAVDTAFESLGSENPDAEPAETEAPAPSIEQMKQAGVLTTAANLSGAKTIGLNRARRLYTLRGQNAKTTGMTEDDIKALLKRLNVEHLRDLDVKHHELFEKFCTGEDMGWKDILATK
jgi:hypothetical protein